MNIVNLINAHLQVTTILVILSVIAITSRQVLVRARCTNQIPAQLTPLLDCVNKLDGTCLGEEVKCLRNNVLNQPQLNNLTGSWDGSLTFFNQYLDKINATYQSVTHTPCPWKYEEQYDDNRYPRYVHNVSCHSPQHCYDNTGCKIASCRCQEIAYTMPTLRRINSNSAGQHWEVKYTTVNVACVPRFY